MCTLRMREKEKLPGESSGQSLTSPQSSLLGFRSVIVTQAAKSGCCKVSEHRLLEKLE